MTNTSVYNGWKSVNKQEYLLRPLILAPRHSTIYHLETKYAQRHPPSHSKCSLIRWISFLSYSARLLSFFNFIAYHFFQLTVLLNQTSQFRSSFAKFEICHQQCRMIILLAWINRNGDFTKRKKLQNGAIL